MCEKEKDCTKVERSEIISQDCEQNEKDECVTSDVSRRNSVVDWIHEYGELLSEILLLVCTGGIMFAMIMLFSIISLLH